MTRQDGFQPLLLEAQERGEVKQVRDLPLSIWRRINHRDFLRHRRHHLTSLFEREVTTRIADDDNDIETAIPVLRRSSSMNFISHDEADLIDGVLSIATRVVEDIMIPISKVFLLNVDSELNRNKMAEINSTGYSRIPVYEGQDRGNIKGYLITKKLIVCDTVLYQ